MTPDVAFPQSAIVGSIGALAKTMAEGTEVPEEFYFAAGLTALGALCANRLKVAANVDCEPRLFTVLLGESADVKKSTAQRRTVEWFQPFFEKVVKVSSGVGSAEGLGRELNEHSNVLLRYDELKALMDKTSIQGSTLLAMTASLFEATTWSNATKDPKNSVTVSNGHLSLLGCCTSETYSRMWTSEAIAIGLPNRLFIVGADRKRKVAWPERPNQDQLDLTSKWLREQLSVLPKTYDITPEAKERWSKWYISLPSSEHAKRLDTIGFHLMPLLALTLGRNSIDGQVMDALLPILDYEITIRMVTDPIDADNQIAEMEQRITRVLTAKGNLTRRLLQQSTNARRIGLWAFDRALSNLVREHLIQVDKSTAQYVLATEWCSQFRSQSPNVV